MSSIKFKKCKFYPVYSYKRTTKPLKNFIKMYVVYLTIRGQWTLNQIKYHGSY